jgi:hypothetical protein
VDEVNLRQGGPPLNEGHGDAMAIWSDAP